ncbi:MAG: hypothetical protein KJZ78_12785 [Bryobacteraceae bacterium]|nr:hypothetical protein [Bryobacteraceae bacterium]
MQVDPLYVHLWDHKDDEGFREDFREKLLNLIEDSISEMDTSDLQEVAQFIDIVENDRGCTTPAEEFIKNLVFGHYARPGEGLTPKIARAELETFREHFADAVEITKRFNRIYSSSVNAEAESEEEAA